MTMELKPPQLTRLNSIVSRLARQHGLHQESVRQRIELSLADNRGSVYTAMSECADQIEEEHIENLLNEAADGLIASSNYSDKERVLHLLRQELHRQWSHQSRRTFIEVLGDVVAFLRTEEKNLLSDDGPAFTSGSDTGSYTGTGHTSGGGTRIIRSGKPMS